MAEGITNSSDALNVLQKVYSVGSLYFNTTDIHPATIFGFGTWERVGKNMTLWGASADGQGGTTKAAGLPNIAGNIGLSTGMVVSNVDGNTLVGSGAFAPYAAEVSAQRTVTANASSITMNPRYMDFSASRSNSIYGGSTTVQPPAFVVNIWRRTA